jgi:transglutaminase-like putative cysteine protease
MIPLLISSVVFATPTNEPTTRSIQIEVAVTIADLPADTPINVYVPIAQDAARQTVKRTDINANINGTVKTESKYGNQFWHGQTDNLSDGTITVTLTQVVERTSAGGLKPTDEEKSLFLQPNSRVMVAGPLVDKALSGLGSHDDSPKGITRAIYDSVIDTMEYKKTGSGWGNGDTEWACTEKYGNCTDFHAMFTSMARAKNIPARFEIGYSVPLESSSGTIGGYHCWLELALPDEGWFPIDASQAKKHPEQREALFGSQPLDRVQFSVGRDLSLEDQQAAPLNYFIYPHVEVNGKKWDKVTSTVTYSTPSP